VPRLAPLGYPIVVERGALARAAHVAWETAPGHAAAVIADETVAAHHLMALLEPLEAAGYARAIVLTVPPGEHHKTRESWARLTDALLAAGCGRDTTIVALGGGVIGDLAGFVAATFLRGVPVVQLPTTLLAMVDASVGGKTGVDTPAGKNLVGAFHQPAAVIIDPEVLATLPGRALRAGMAEVIKHGVIADSAYLDEVEAALPELDAMARRGDDRLAALVARSVEIKGAVVARDEREQGERRILNFGHTIGHAVEAASGWTLQHGEAVAIGMVVEADIAGRLGLADGDVAERVRRVVHRAGLPAAVPRELDEGALLALTHADKKAAAGRVRYALPARVGAMAGADEGWSVIVDEELVRDAIAANRSE
jgi:3-dehydroquinate synthase